MNPKTRRLAHLWKTVKHSSAIHDLLIFSGSLGLYIRTLCPSVYTFDSAEYVAGAYSLGIVHATGYPLYLMLAKLFTLIVPLGDIAYRVNLFSALCGALSLVILRRVAHIITGSASAAFLGTALFGVSYPFWSMALVAEVYTLHILFLCSILWMVLHWRATGQEKYLIALALTLGLSFGNHMSTILIVPGVVNLVWETLKHKHVPFPPLLTWIAVFIAFSVTLLTYLYLPIRYAADPALNYATLIGVDLSTFKGIIWWVRGSMFADSMFSYPLVDIPNETWRFLQLLWRSFLGFGPIVAALGFMEIWKRDRSLALTLSLIFAVNVIFYINYRPVDKETMFLPAFVIISLWIAAGLCGLQSRLSVGIPQQALSWFVGVLLIVTLILVFPQADLSDNWITRQYAEAVFKQAPQEAFIIGWWIDILPLKYLQIVEGQRQDITLFDYGLFNIGQESLLQERGFSKPSSWRIANQAIRQEITNQIAAGRPTFSLGRNTILEPAFKFETVSEWLYSITPANHKILPP